MHWAATATAYARTADAAPGVAAVVAARAVAEVAGRAVGRAAGRAAGRATAERVAIVMAVARIENGIGDDIGNKESDGGVRAGAVGGDDCSAGMVYAATANGVRARVLRRRQRRVRTAATAEACSQGLAQRLARQSRP